MFQFRRFPAYAYFIQRTLTEYCSAGFPHSEIRGYIAYVQLPTAYRSLSRPSSALDAKAFPLRSFQLDLVGADFVSLASASGESSLTPSRLLSKSNPLRWASIWLEIWFSQELCRPQIWFIVVFVLPFFKVHKLKLCYLSVACSQFLACFTVQFSRCTLQPCFKVRSKRSDCCPNASI